MKARRRFPTCVILVGTVLAGAHCAAWLFPGIFEPLRYQLSDRLFALRSRSESLRPVYDDVVVHVPITDESRRRSRNFYVDRPDYARLVRTLGRLDVAAQFHDVVFARPLEERFDSVLEEAIAGAGSAYFGMALGVDRPRQAADRSTIVPEIRGALDANRWHPVVIGDPASIPSVAKTYVTLPRFAAAARGLGFLDIVADRDGVFRRARLLARDEDGFQPSLSLHVLADYLGVEKDEIEVRPGRSITLRGARRPDRETARDIVIPIDAEGRMIVNFIGPWGSMKHYPHDVIGEASGDRFFLEDLREELQGKIVVVSWVATGSGDVGTVPTDPLLPLSGIHANVIHTVLTGDFLHELSLTGMLLWIHLPLLAIILFAGLRLSTLWLALLSAGLGIAYYALAHAAFFYGNLLLDIPGPLTVLIGSTILLAAYQYHLESQAKAVLRTRFDAYFPPAVVDKIMSQGDGLVSAAQKKEISILFSDIKNFTRQTADMDAAHVRRLLNEYFEQMIEIVFHHEGTLDKFIGDGLMVFFGDPTDQPDHAERCVRAAVDMQRAARKLARELDARGDMRLEIRIGINTGVAVVGNMGSNRRLSYTALGESVNLAQRLESNAPVGGILISKRTHDLLDGAVPTVEHAPIVAKGFERPIEVREIPVPD